MNSQKKGAGKKEYARPHMHNRVGPSGSMKSGSGRGGLDVRFVRGIQGTDPVLSVPYPQIAFVGRSNVGKSSLINALLGGVFARVSAVPGKTQEINFYSVDDRLFVVDLPGYGYAKLPIPVAEKIRKHILWYLGGDEVKPRLVVLIVDARQGVTTQDRELITVCKNEQHDILVAFNKWDKLNQSERVKAERAFVAEYPELEWIAVSAEKKYHVAELFLRLGLKK